MVFEDALSTTLHRKTWYILIACGIGLGLLVYLARELIPPNLEHIDQAVQFIHSFPIDLMHKAVTVSQSFTANEDNIAAISFYVLDIGSESAISPVFFRLYAQKDNRLLAEREINLQRSSVPGYTIVDLGAVSTSLDDQGYRFVLQNAANSDQENIILGGSGSRHYTDGELSIDDQKQTGDLSFIVYTRPTLIRLLSWGIESISKFAFPLSMALLVLLTSGMLIWPAIHSRIGSDTPLIFAVTVVISPLVPSLMLLTSYAFGLAFSPIILLFISLIIPLLFVTRNRAVLSAKQFTNSRTISLVICTCFILVIQMGALHDVALPLNVDSVHHVILSQEIAARRSLPDYPNDGPLIYHTGFHAFVSSLMLFSNQTIDGNTAVLVAGPVLLLLCALGIYCLVRVVMCSHWCALCGMILVTFALSMPSFALNWGKYPVLLALSTSCGVLTLAVISLKQNVRFLMKTMNGLLVAATCLVHTRMIFIWGAVFLLISALRLNQLKSLKAMALDMGQYLIVPIIVLGAWVLPNWINYTNFTSQPMTPNTITSLPASNQYAPFVYPFSQVEMIWLGILMLGFVSMGYKKMAVRALIACTVLLITLASLVPVEQFPGKRLLDEQFAYIAVSIPIAMGVVIVVQFLSSFAHDRFGLPTWFAPAALSVVAVLGIPARQGTFSLCCQIASQSDVDNLTWMSNSVPLSATIGIASTLWPDGQAIGTDGGYWINALTGRATTLPSLLYGFSDANTQSAITRRAIEVDATIRRQGDVCGLDIDYVYVGERPDSFESLVLAKNPHLQLVYQNGPSAIFRVQGCKPR